MMVPRLSGFTTQTTQLMPGLLVELAELQRVACCPA